MSAAHKARIDEMIFNPHYREMIHRLRKPVSDLKEHITASGRDVQKVQLFMPDNALRLRLMAALPTMFEGLAVSSSISENIEINDEKAHKGAALLALADYLGLRREDTYAFGDGLNDLTMLRDAGTGIAMANAEPEAKAAADRLTCSCDEDGVACGIDEILKTI
jgi:hydroxymethylpyrimidine pyrophosphatase-like HAD family hydrolase